MSDWKQIKKGAEVELAGAAFEFEREDGNIKRVTITDKDGKRVRISVQQYGNGLEIMLPTPAPKVEKFAVTAEVAGVPLSVVFDDAGDAREKQRELARAGIEAEVTPNIVDDDIPF